MTESENSPPVIPGGLNTEVTRSGRIGHGVAAGCLLAVFVASFLGVDRWNLACLSPSVGEGTSTCLLRRVTGLPCATCGMTRSFCAIGRGDLGAAFEQHPLGPVLYVFFALVMLRSAAVALAGRRVVRWSGRAFVWMGAVLAAAILVLWVVHLCQIIAGGEAAEAWRASALGQLIEHLK
jgi:hypothetical protein